MSINSINNVGNLNYGINFKSNQAKTQYENPIDRKTEKNLAILTTTGAAGLVGVIAGGLTTLFTKGKKFPIIAGLVAAAGTLGLMLPSKIYNTKVNAYAKEKEMDVFSRQKSAQTNIYEDINDEIKDNNVSLDDKINHYATVKMADNGNGMMIKGV